MVQVECSGVKRIRRELAFSFRFSLGVRFEEFIKNLLQNRTKKMNDKNIVLKKIYFLSLLRMENETIKIIFYWILLKLLLFYGHFSYLKTQN